MHIICKTENLAKGVNLVSKISTSRGSLPILSNILLKAQDGDIILSATDLELGIKTQILGKVEIGGSITIPARLLNEFVNSCNDEQLEITLEGESVKLASQKYTAHLNGLDASEFPLIPEIKGDAFVEIESDIFRNALAQVAFAASRDETRPILTGVCFIFKGKEIKLVATDSYRLVEKIISSNKEFSEELAVIIPVSTILEALRIITPEEPLIGMFLTDNQVMFVIGKTTIISRVIEGKFPDYEQIIPKKFSTTTSIDKSELINALKLTNLFARESANNVRLKLKKDILELIAIAPQVGDNIAKLKTKTEGDDMEIAFNTKYLLDALAQIHREKIVINTNRPSSGSERTDPGMILGEGETDYRSIIMPLRMDE